MPLLDLHTCCAETGSNRISVRSGLSSLSVRPSVHLFLQAKHVFVDDPVKCALHGIE